MAWITVATPSFASIEQVDAVLAQLDGAPDGMEGRYIGTAEDGKLRVVSLWQSKAHAERFFAEKLGPALAKALGPEILGSTSSARTSASRSPEARRQPKGRTKWSPQMLTSAVGRRGRLSPFSWPRRH